MQLQMREERQNGVIILAPQGRLDSGKIEQFNRIIQERIRTGHHRLLIDCTNLVFAASSALRILLKTLRTLNERDGKLVLCNMNPHIRGIFDTSGFTKLMDIRDTVEEGLAEVQPPGASQPEPAPKPTPEATPEATPSPETTATPQTSQQHESIVVSIILAPFRLAALIVLAPFRLIRAITSRNRR